MPFDQRGGCSGWRSLVIGWPFTVMVVLLLIEWPLPASALAVIT